MTLQDDIRRFLTENGLEDRIGLIVPINICAQSPEEAAKQSEKIKDVIAQHLSGIPSVPPTISVVASRPPALAISIPLISVRKDAPQSRIVSLMM